jgi:hypothetical protein
MRRMNIARKTRHGKKTVGVVYLGLATLRTQVLDVQQLLFQMQASFDRFVLLLHDGMGPSQKVLRATL